MHAGKFRLKEVLPSFLPHMSFQWAVVSVSAIIRAVLITSAELDKNFHRRKTWGHLLKTQWTYQTSTWKRQASTWTATRELNKRRQKLERSWFSNAKRIYCGTDHLSTPLPPIHLSATMWAVSHIKVWPRYKITREKLISEKTTWPNQIWVSCKKIAK